MARINKTKYIILGMLYKNELSGYEIKNWIDTQFKYFWSESYGQIYPMLKKLEKEELISKTTDNNNSRQKHIYSITEKGKENFRDYMKLSCDEEKLKSELLLKMAFGYLIPIKYTIKNLEEYRDRELKKKREYEEIEKHLEKNNNETTKNLHIYSSITLNMSKKLNKAQLEWVEESLEILKTMKID